MKNRIKELRERKGLTQEQLGEVVGTSRQAIHAIETEKFEPSIEEVFIFEDSTRKSRAESSRRDCNGY